MMTEQDTEGMIIICGKNDSDTDIGEHPRVAVINETGNFEIALCCHHRIALDDPKIKIGLPHTRKGVLPGRGAIVRLVHLLGPKIAASFLLEGREVSPKEALELKIIDELANSEEELIQKAKEWIIKNPNPTQAWDRPDHVIPGGDPKEYLVTSPVMLFKKTKGVYPALIEVLKVIAETLKLDFDTALRVDSRAFKKIANSREAKNMNQSINFPPPKHLIKKLGILGGGMMGRAIAAVSAKAGIEVIIKEVSQEAADKAKAYNPSHLVKATTDYNALSGCELIIEAVYENIDLKREVTQNAEPKLTSQGIFASNTSSLPITKLAGASTRPENFIGIHFFSPVEKMPLIEIIVGEKTSKETLAKAFDFALQVKKTPIVVNDSPGFFTTRVVNTYIQEAACMLKSGVHPVRIDRLARLAGFPAPPLALWDEVSQRLFHSIAAQNGVRSGPQFEIAELLINTYKRGGKAYGGGIYEYLADGSKHIWPEIIKLFYKPQYQIPDQDIQDRFLFIQSLETMRCIEEGVIENIQDANIGSIYGIGYPPVTGGVIQNVNTYGVKKFLDRVTDLAEKYGEQFAPPKILQEKAIKNEIFV